MSKSPEGLNVLTKEQVNSYNENGFLIVENVIPQNDLEVLRFEHDRIAEEWAITNEGWRGSGNYQSAEEKQKSRLTSMHHLEQASGAFAKLIFGNETLSGTAADLLASDEVEFVFSTLHTKAPGGGFRLPKHTDGAHYGHSRRPDGTSGVVLAVPHLDTTTDRNGALQFYPGSHKRLFPHVTNPDVAPFIEDEVWKREWGDSEPVAAKLEAGGAIFFDPYTVHASSRNETDKPRRAARIVLRDPRRALVHGGIGGIPPTEARPMVRGVRPQDAATRPIISASGA